MEEENEGRLRRRFQVGVWEIILGTIMLTTSLISYDKNGIGWLNSFTFILGIINCISGYLKIHETSEIKK